MDAVLVALLLSANMEFASALLAYAGGTLTEAEVLEAVERTCTSMMETVAARQAKAA